jgi:hypothetical protein
MDNNLSLQGISENIRTIYEKNLGKKCGITRFGIKSYSTKNNKKSRLYLDCSRAPGGDIGTRGKTGAPQLPTLYPVIYAAWRTYYKDIATHGKTCAPQLPTLYPVIYAALRTCYKDIGTRGKTCAPQLPTLYPGIRGIAHLLPVLRSDLQDGNLKKKITSFLLITF